MEPTRQAGPPAGTASLPADGRLERSGPRSTEPRRDLIAAIHTASTTAGIALLLLALLAAFGDLVVVGRLRLAAATASLTRPEPQDRSADEASLSATTAVQMNE